MNDLLSYLTRSSGVVALVLIVAAIADGLIFSGREGGRRLRPAWWMDLHRGLGGYALIFTVLHLVTAYGAGMGIRLIDALVPGVSPWSTTAMTLGVLALYAMVLSTFTTWPKRRLPRKLWHVVHVLTVPAAVAAGVHGWQLGSDAGSTWYLALSLVLTAVATYPLGLRLSGAFRRRRADGNAAPVVPAAPSSPTTPTAVERELVDTHR